MPVGAIHENVPVAVNSACPICGNVAVAPVAVKFVTTPTIGTLVPDVT